MSSKKNKVRPSQDGGRVESVAMPETASEAAANPGLVKVKEETLVWMLSILSAMVAYAVLAYVIRSVYHPDTAALAATAKKLLVSPESARPEPGEALLFRAGLLVFTLGMLGFYALYSKMKQVKEMAQKPALLVLSVVCIAILAALMYCDFAAQNPFVKDGGDTPQNSRDFIGVSNFDFYFDGFFIGSYVLPYIFLIVPLLAALFLFGFKKYKWNESKAFRTGTNVVGFGVLGGLLLACAAMSAFYYPYSFENKYNYNAVYYSMTQVYSGVPMLVDGFTNTYGLYPQFLNPLFQVIGLSVVKFTSVMAVLLTLAFAMNIYSATKFVSNRVILFLGLLSVIYFPFLLFKLGQAFDCNFAVYPIRYIVPSTLILLTTIYLHKRAKWLYWLTTTVMAFFVLWNPELGLVCYLSWLAMNIFTDFYNGEGKINIKAIVVHLGAAIAMILVAFFSYKLLIQAIYGASPELGTLFSTMAVFGSVGFNMLPLKLVHPWNLMAIVIILGFMYAMSKWYKKEVTPKVSMVFLVSLLGLGYFFYYQGRSHNWQLAQSSGMTFLLLTLLGDELWKKVKSYSVPLLNAMFVLFLLVISFSFFEVLYNTDKIKEMVYQEEDKEKNEPDMKRFDSNRDFIMKNSKEGEKVYMIVPMQFQGLYFDGTKRKGAFNPGEMDMFLNTDVVRMENRLMDSSNSIFIEPSLCNFPFMARPGAAIAATYEYKGVNQTMAYLTKRQIKIPLEEFFKSDAQVLHKKYQDNTAGVKLRIDDAQGLAPLILNPEFSVELLFNTRMQVYQFAALIGNMTDTTGFLIHNVLNSSNYFFGINGKGVSLPMPLNEWVYCVMNVYPDRVEVFRNGESIGAFPIAQPMKQSPEKLFIGNIGFMHYYVGAIAEVSVNNKAVDKARVADTWMQIKSKI